jgi:chromosome segregation ATPase
VGDGGRLDSSPTPTGPHNPLGSTVLAEPGRGEDQGGRAAEGRAGREGYRAHQQAESRLQQEQSANQQAESRLQQERATLEEARATLKLRDEEISRLDGELNQLSVSHEELRQAGKEKDATILDLQQAAEIACTTLEAEKKQVEGDSSFSAFRLSV